MDNQNTDPKVIAKLKRMLAIANDTRTDEGTANNAADLAQKLMMEHNISMAQIDSHSDGDKRTKTKDDGNAKYAFQRELMQACADVNFVYQEVRYDYSKTYPKALGYTLIGREANVASTKILFEYLFNVTERLAVEYVGDASQAYSIAANSFKEGCAARLGERLRQRHRDALREQARKAREANVAARHPSSSGTALTVVMEDYAQIEKDRNEDLRLGKPEGFTAHKRLMATRGSEIASAIQDAFGPLIKTVGDRDVLMQAARAAFEALCANRSWTVDEELSQLFERQAAQCIYQHLDRYNEAVRYAKLTPLQRQREEEREARASERWWNAYNRRQGRGERAAPSAIDGEAYSAGSQAGAKVGLDAQVDREERKGLK